jgi:tRNA pseudouridine(38-40) synthase
LKDGYEFAVVKVRGQSFMLHQIRKMVGLVIAVVRGMASKQTIESCWTANKVDKLFKNRAYSIPFWDVSIYFSRLMYRQRQL